MAYLGRYLASGQKNSSIISILAMLDYLLENFPEVAGSIVQELKDQRSFLKLIASENYSSLAVQLAMGNWLTDKYSEGIIGKRFYAGCENVDAVEKRAAELAIKIFNADHAYVQPHSGADANMIAFWAMIVKGVQNRETEALNKKSIDELSVDEYEQIRKIMVSQKVMGMSLNSGGHLTHGYRHNISSKMMQAVSYDVDPETGLIDYDKLAKEVKRERPLILIAGYSAYPRLIDFAKMREIADSVGAYLMVDMAHFAGLVAGKVFTGNYDPVPFAHIVTSTTHKTLRGPRGGLILCKSEFKEVIDKGCPLVQGGPLPHIMAAKAVAFEEASRAEFREYAHQIVRNAKALADELMKLNVRVLTKGTDNHMILVDVNDSFSLTGRQAEKALRDAFLTLNRNSIFGDKNGPWYTSGIRIGTPAATSLGMKENEMKIIAKAIERVLKNSTPVVEDGKKSLIKFRTEEKSLTEVQETVLDLLKRFPLYPELEI